MCTPPLLNALPSSPEVINEAKPLPRVEDGSRDTSRTDHKRNLGFGTREALRGSVCVSAVHKFHERVWNVNTFMSAWFVCILHTEPRSVIREFETFSNFMRNQCTFPSKPQRYAPQEASPRCVTLSCSDDRSSPIPGALLCPQNLCVCHAVPRGRSAWRRGQ